jgi:hypothetical protein
MNAYKVDAIRQSRRYTNVTEDGLAILKDYHYQLVRHGNDYYYYSSTLGVGCEYFRSSN